MTEKWIGGNDELLAGIAFGEYAWSSTPAMGAGRRFAGPTATASTPCRSSTTSSHDEVTIDVANAVHAASGVTEHIYHDIALSPDNSQIGYNANHLVGKGKNKV